MLRGPQLQTLSHAERLHLLAIAEFFGIEVSVC